MLKIAIQTSRMLARLSSSKKSQLYWKKLNKAQKYFLKKVSKSLTCSKMLKICKNFKFTFYNDQICSKICISQLLKKKFTRCLKLLKNDQIWWNILKKAQKSVKLLKNLQCFFQKCSKLIKFAQKCSYLLKNDSVCSKTCDLIEEFYEVPN